jgi:hypothetical protein
MVETNTCGDDACPGRQDQERGNHRYYQEGDDRDAVPAIPGIAPPGQTRTLSQRHEESLTASAAHQLRFLSILLMHHLNLTPSITDAKYHHVTGYTAQCKANIHYPLEVAHRSSSERTQIFPRSNKTKASVPFLRCKPMSSKAGR